MSLLLLFAALFFPKQKWRFLCYTLKLLDERYFKFQTGNSLVVHWLGLCAFTAGVWGEQAEWCNQKKPFLTNIIWWQLRCKGPGEEDIKDNSSVSRFAAAAKSLQSRPTLCDPVDGSPPGSPVPGILQARTLERVAISFSSF